MNSFILWVAIQDSFPQVTPSCQLPPFGANFHRPVEEKKQFRTMLKRKKSGKKVVKKCDKNEFLCKLLHYKIKQKVVIFEVRLLYSTTIDTDTLLEQLTHDSTFYSYDE